jgi:Na+-translocating ferredoxin:NAD+ oxidoreductase RnfD subunit
VKEGRDLSRLRVNATSSTILDPFTLAGIAGTALIIVAYFANQQGWLKADDWKYPLANLIGAVLILVSLITAWNLPVAVIESFWAAISIYGLIKNAGRSKG